MSQPKRKRGRPRKHPLPIHNPQPIQSPPQVPEPGAIRILPGEEIPNPQILPPESPGGIGGSSSDNFERVAAAIPGVIGDGVTAGPGAAPPTIDGATGKVINYNLSPENVAHWINIPFDMLAAALDNDTYKLLEFEKQMFSPAVSACLERYLPELLKKTDQPELAALGLAATIYAARVGLFTWINGKAKPKQEPGPGAMPQNPAASTAGASTTLAFAGLPGSSDNQKQGKVF